MTSAFSSARAVEHMGVRQRMVQIEYLDDPVRLPHPARREAGAPVGAHGQL